MKSPNKPENYIPLRNIICARVTLFNGRRGREPARLKIKEIEDGFSDKWIDSQRLHLLDDVEKQLLNVLTY